MKPLKTKHVIAGSLLTLSLAHAGFALAHTQGGGLGAAATATDYYQVTCSNNGSGAPQSLVVQVSDDAAVATPVVSVLVHKGLVATNSSDATDGDGVASTLVSLNGGAGVYNVFLSKTAAGAENYTLTFHCQTGLNGAGVHTGTAITSRQNQ